MSQFARVESVEALRAFKAALVKFGEHIRVALADAEGDLRHTTSWVQNEQRSYWQGQLNKRQAAALKAREALRAKQLFHSDLTSKHAAAEEEKALAMALRALEEAQQKVLATQMWGRKLDQESIVYRALAQRAGNQADIAVPEALARLERMIASLDAYLALEVPEAVAPRSAEGGFDETTGSMGIAPPGGMDATGGAGPALVPDQAAERPATEPAETPAPPASPASPGPAASEAPGAAPPAGAAAGPATLGKTEGAV